MANELENYQRMMDDLIRQATEESDPDNPQPRVVRKLPLQRVWDQRGTVVGPFR